tara:strand:+ start:583 stop:864 length:282 start_codon:yes stop_codon:yes gene_type:complete
LKAQPLKNILSEYLNREPIKKINNIINIQNIWTEVVGKTISINTEIIEIKNKTLLVKTKNPIWRNELSLQKTDLLKKLNKNKHINNIKDIRFI